MNNNKEYQQLFGPLNRKIAFFKQPHPLIWHCHKKNWFEKEINFVILRLYWAREGRLLTSFHCSWVVGTTFLNFGWLTFEFFGRNLSACWSVCESTVSDLIRNISPRGDRLVFFIIGKLNIERIWKVIRAILSLIWSNSDSPLLLGR